ncbi:hypothetical protein FANTH_9995 [Fusarium anthophilum]|uniref:RanBP2-type domain-containing protein n=1 Tax=Fusarium anthophilum TaxID=48485 RepID=A0A8H4Z3L3_9HYPO|nr:hypothetical protein FANTH_9995 [Fusarium anthophilum]
MKQDSSAVTSDLDIKEHGYKSGVRTMTETHNNPPETILFWQCKQRLGKKKCDYLNHKENKTCNECNSKRDKGDVALDKHKRKVGILKEVDGLVEHWEHFEMDEPVQGGTRA